MTVKGASSESPGAAPEKSPALHLVGREQELIKLREQLDAALSGKGELALISGEPGIGKTTLCDALAEEAARRGVHVAWGRCWDGLASPAFWPWIQILRSLLAELDTSDPRVSSDLEAAQRLMPELMPGGEIAGGRDPLSDEDTDAESLRFRQFDAVQRLLQNISRTIPSLLIFDDCHVADELSLRLLAFVGKQFRQIRIMVAITFRDVDIKQRPVANQIVQELGRDGRRYSLQNLTQEEVGTFLKAKAPTIKDAGTVERLYRTTEGNPFFLGEIAGLLAARHRGKRAVDWNSEGLEIPEQVGAAIRQRYVGLSEQARRVLDIAATIGLEFDVPMLAKVAALDVVAIARSLGKLEELGLVRSNLKHSARYKFVHALFAETLYNDLAPPARRETHLKIASALAAEQRDQSEIASHLLRALPEGDFKRAIEAAKQAAQRSTEAMSYENAVNFCQLALAAFEDYGTHRSAEHCELVLNLAEANHRGGNFSDALVCFERSAEMAHELGDAKAYARAVFGMGSWSETPGVTNLKLIRHLEDALSLLGETDIGWRARLLARLAEALQYSDSADRRNSLASEAIALARQVNDPAALAEVLYRIYVALLSPDQADDRLATATEILDLSRRTRNARLGLRAHYLRIRDLLELGQIEHLDRELQTYTQMTAELRQQHLGYAEAMLTMRAMMDGRFDEAERLALDALNLGQNRHDGMAAQVYATQISLIRREQDRLAEMEPIIKTFVVQFPDLVFARCALAFCYSESKRRDDAALHFEHLAQNDFSRVRRDFSWLAAMALLSEASVFLSDTQRAETLYQHLLPFEPRQASLDMYVTYGPVALYLGMLATLLGRFDAAETHFRTALASTAGSGARPWLAHSKFRYATMLVERGADNDRERAAELVQSVLASADTLGMKKLGDEARHLRRRLSGGDDVVDTAAQSRARGRAIVSVLFVDIVGSTEMAARIGDRPWRELLAKFYGEVRRNLARFEGREIENPGDGFVAVFPSTLAAINAARQIATAVRALGLKIRAGVHVGECEWIGHQAVGITIHIGARIASAAKPGELLVSAAAHDVVSGSGLGFDDAGRHELRGVPGEWQLYRVTS
jgi:eukaryotic-like serine/threonine-protein kinase